MTDVTAAAENASKPGRDERLAYRGVGQRMLIRPEIVGILAALLLYMFFWAVTRPFGSAGGVATVLDVSATLGIMAVAVGILMIGGEFDLSSGAMTGAMGIIIILLVKQTGEMGGAGLSYWIAIPLSLAIALGIGWLNGTMVEKTALPSFIVTLATFFVLRGLKLAGSKIVVDQIQVGRADEGDGFGFWQNIFGSTWERQDHVWAARDGVYTVLVLVGGVLLIVALIELAFRRADTLNPSGLPVFGAGLGGIAVGVILMHTLDGSDWVPMLVFALSAPIAAIGLAQWRYHRLEDRGSVEFGAEVVRPLGIGITAGVVAVGVALFFDSADDSDLVPFVTEQGLRAILFVALLTAAAGYVAVAVYHARRISAATKCAVLGVAALGTFLMALFIQSESEGPKLRTELFGMLSVLALLILSWAAVSWLVDVRRTEDDAADRLGRRVALIGGVLVAVGLVVRLIFAVQAEIDAENSSRLAVFSIRIVWFVGFTGVMSYVLRSTPFGSWVYAVGGNKEAARQIGVPAARTKTQLFMLVAAAAWLVGILLAFRLNTIQAGTGNGLEFEYIIAAVVGGTFLTGGYGSVLGAAIGALIMAMSKQGISFAGWNTDWRFVFLGGILLAAVVANGYVRRVAEAIR
jgi:ribose/xylose/arabinose/galactoside ABC-type transport system permease subunit